jgi:hypothetical protein
MGMFDNLICKYPLPGTTPEFVKIEPLFQTKSLDCEMTTYTIDEKGLLHDEIDFLPDTPIAFTGEIEFYGGNSCGGSPSFTSDGRDAEWAEYKAIFHEGRLKSIEQTEYERKLALPESARIHKPPPTAAELAEWEKAKSQSFIGKRLWLAFGGKPAEQGFWVTVIAENDRELVLKGNDAYGREFRVEDRGFYGYILFDTMEDAVERDRAKKDKYDATKAKYDELLKNRGALCPSQSITSPCRPSVPT